MASLFTTMALDIPIFARIKNYLSLIWILLDLEASPAKGYLDASLLKCQKVLLNQAILFDSFSEVSPIHKPQGLTLARV